MGFYIKIGEPEIRVDSFTGKITPYINEVEWSLAPELGHGDASGYSNVRRPSYTGMKAFAVIAGLNQMFYGENGLLEEHPGITVLHPWHYREFDAAIRTLERDGKTQPKDPAKIACKGTTIAGPCCGLTERDWVYGKLLWYRFWTGWALENCETPAFSNR